MLDVDVAIVTKAQLRNALELSGLSYEQPPEEDVNKVWGALQFDGRIITIETDDA